MPKHATARPQDGERRPRARASRRRRRSIGWWLAGLAAVAGIAFFYFGAVRPYDPSVEAISSPGAAERPADPRITLVAGQTAPDFTLPSAADDGAVKLSDLRARGNVLLYFQEGLMCPPCWQQMRDLKRDGDKLAALDVTLVTITVDPLDQLRENIAREAIEGMILLGDHEARVSKRYQATFISMHPGERPGHTFILVGKDGKILWRRDFKEMYVQDQVILEPIAKALGRP